MYFDGTKVLANASTESVKPLFAEAKDWHGLRRFRLRELWRVNCEALRIAAGRNLKRLLKKRGWGRRPFPTEAFCAFFFERSDNRDITETISLLARMARFAIADITDARSIPQELSVIVPDLPSVPVQPLILNSQHEYGMFEHFTRYPWVLPVYQYSDVDDVLQSLQERIIKSAEQKAQELAKW